MTISVTMASDNICSHHWVYQNMLLLSDPPQIRRICKDCLKQETVVCGNPSYVSDVESYEDFVKKVNEKEKL